ncbi:hypothetical protein ACFRJ1_30325 [Streptomyces sp. NPDC056773]|uniref:hypothetical protein n=1 Tax=unclassified Streptomyces TaxID=2593676 RepID=UPI0036BF6E37
MERTQLWWKACGVMAGVVLLAACGGGGGDAGDADGEGGAGDGAVMSAEAAPSADASTGPAGGSDAPVLDKAAFAEKLKTDLEARIPLDEERFGSGTGSPCSAASAKLFTQECADAAEVTNEHATWALTRTRGREEGFATLTAAAQKIQKAAARYQELGCAKNPADPSDRGACLEAGAVLAQGFPDLRGGANLGLAGK